MDVRELTGSCKADQTVLMTETTSVLLVKWDIPSSPFSCWKPITNAAPPMKPTMAAWERKSTKNPNLADSWELKKHKMRSIQKQWETERNLRNPQADWNRPAKKVAVKTILLYAVGSTDGSTTFWTMEDRSREIAATGPIAISFELPITA